MRGSACPMCSTDLSANLQLLSKSATKIQRVFREKYPTNSHKTYKLLLALAVGQAHMKAAALEVSRAFRNNYRNWKPTFNSTFNKSVFNHLKSLEAGELITALSDENSNQRFDHYQADGTYGIELGDISDNELEAIQQQCSKSSEMLVNQHKITVDDLEKSFDLFNEAYSIFIEMIPDEQFSPRCQNSMSHLIFSPERQLNSMELNPYFEPVSPYSESLEFRTPIDSATRYFLMDIKDCALGGKKGEWNNMWHEEKYQYYKTKLDSLKSKLQSHTEALYKKHPEARRA